MAYAIAYDAAGGGTVMVPRRVKPYQELGVASGASRTEIKTAFKRRANQNSRQDRVMASLSYHILTSTADGRYRKRGQEYEIIEKDMFVLASTGYTRALLRDISPYKLNQGDEHKRTVLYIAARCGFYDTTKALLEAGAPVNQKQIDGSTPLHGAAFYGQELVVKLLLTYGADPAIKNTWGNSPVDEAATDSIKQLFSDHKKDKIAQLASSLISEGLASRVRFKKHEGKIIGKKIIRNYQQIRSMTKRDWDDILCNWEPSWHGTKSKYIKSILSNGLMPSGARLASGETITPPQNHYQLGQSYFGVSNWAAAIFVSPSLLYASHACYAERFLSESIQWCVVVKTQVRRCSYTDHDPTTLFKQARIDGEPDNSEYRVPCSSDKDKILRVEQSRNVVVTSVVFIKASFLEKISSSNELRYDQLQRLFEAD